MTYKISIPLCTTIELEIDGGGPLRYSDIIALITDIDLREASLHLPESDIRNSLFRALANELLKIEAATT